MHSLAFTSIRSIHTGIAAAGLITCSRLKPWQQLQQWVNGNRTQRPTHTKQPTPISHRMRRCIHSCATPSIGNATAHAITSASGIHQLPTITPTPPIQPIKPSTFPISPHRLNLLGLSMVELQTRLSAAPLHLPTYRAKQIAHAIYTLGLRDFAKMTNLSLPLRQELDRHFRIDYGKLVKEEISQDHTRKFLVGFEGKKNKLAIPTTSNTSEEVSSSSPLEHIECVYIPMNNSTRGAVCVSSQVGCSLTCAFCATGAMDKKRLRNLTAAEIVGQVMHVKQIMGDYNSSNSSSSTSSSAASAPSRSAVTNIVFMGMGEPLYNYRAVRTAIDILTSHPRMGGLGLGLGRPRITLSTSGVAPMLDQLLEDFEGNVSLAISLHAVNDQLRDQLVPINKTYPLAVLMEAVRRYQNNRIVTKTSNDSATSSASFTSDDFTSPLTPAGRRRITFEYVMLRDVNDSLSEAHHLLRLLHGIDSLVNLIPFNPWGGSTYQSSTPQQIEAFSRVLTTGGLNCTVRWPRGRDINGACGQLATNPLRSE